MTGEKEAAVARRSYLELLVDIYAPSVTALPARAILIRSTNIFEA
jgi:hypothetical protein